MPLLELFAFNDELELYLIEKYKAQNGGGK